MDNRVIRNKKVNPRKKFDPSVIDNLDAHITALKSAITEGDMVVNELSGNPGWAVIRRNWQTQLDNVEEQLDLFHTLTDKGRDFLLKERQDLRSNLAILEEIEAKAAGYKAEMGEAIAVLNQRTERVGTAQE